MTRYPAFVASVIVAFALAVPPAVEAQAQRRGGSDSGSSGGSRGGDGGTAAPRSAPAPPPPAVRETPSQPSRPSGATARPSGSRPSAGSSGAPSDRTSPGVSSGARARTVQPARGVAQPRSTAPVPQRPSWDRWDGWSPWYGYGRGYSYGYPYSYGYWGYNPWVYSGYWGRHGWYDPFLYDPFAYGYAVPYWGGSTSSRDVERDDRGPVGSIRLRVNPEHARVYVDGALVGTAAEFGGFGNHLELPAGTHALELRADGYQTWSGQIDVRDNRTRTERVNLKRQ